MGPSRTGVFHGCIATFNFLLLYALMRSTSRARDAPHAGNAGESRRRRGSLAAVCAASSHWLLADWQTQTLLSKLGALLGTVIVGAVVFVGCGVALHIDELKELQARFNAGCGALLDPIGYFHASGHRGARHERA